MEKYFELFSSKEDVENEFAVVLGDDIEIIYADYDTPSYEGYAHVIFRKEGKLYEVNGSHCSCHGLEDQWEPEETSVCALLSRPNVSDRAKANIKEVYKNLMCFC